MKRVIEDVNEPSCFRPCNFISHLLMRARRQKSAKVDAQNKMTPSSAERSSPTLILLLLLLISPKRRPPPWDLLHNATFEQRGTLGCPSLRFFSQLMSTRHRLVINDPHPPPSKWSERFIPYLSATANRIDRCINSPLATQVVMTGQRITYFLTSLLNLQGGTY